MTTYEMMYIIKPTADEAGQKEINDKIKSIIEVNGGSQLAFDSLGKKDLATEFNGNKQGFYFLTTYEGEGIINAELKKYFKITENLLRHLIIVLDKKALANQKDSKKTKKAAKEETTSEEKESVSNNTAETEVASEKETAVEA